jgi:DMSO reductase family type II enzyme chaperone
MAANDAPGGPGALAGEVESDAGARGAVYALLAAAFDQPDEELYRAIETGAFREELAALVDRTALDVAVPDLTTEDDYEHLCARYNDLFVIGFSEVVDATDGTMRHEEPPVSLYESAHRPEVSWNDVNLDLARAYEYFGCQVDQEVRDNHDHLQLQLEFMGYLCRREAAVDPDVAAGSATDIVRGLRREEPRVFVGADSLDAGAFTINPMCLGGDAEVQYVIERIRAHAT